MSPAETSWLASSVSKSPPTSTPSVCLIHLASNFALCAILTGRAARQQFAQRAQRLAVLQVAVGEAVEVNDAHAVRRGQLYEAQSAAVGIEVGRLRVEADDGVCVAIPRRPSAVPRAW